MPPKRKRTNTVSSSSAAAVDVPQPSSRDASGEDTEDPVLQELKQRQAETSTSTKRARSSSKTDAADADDDDAADTRAAKAARTESQEMTKEEKREQAFEEGENGEKGKMRMPDPPRAGIVDPVGFKTNPPPEGRAVRVYADGVFDLFHLGYVEMILIGSVSTAANPVVADTCDSFSKLRWPSLTRTCSLALPETKRPTRGKG